MYLLQARLTDSSILAEKSYIEIISLSTHKNHEFRKGFRFRGGSS